MVQNIRIFVFRKEKEYLSWGIKLKESSVIKMCWYRRDRALLKTICIAVQTLGWTQLYEKDEKSHNTD